MDLEGRVVTADAMHTQVEHARFIVEDKKADYVFPVKQNQGNLFETIKSIKNEHGRIEKRTIKTVPVKKGQTNFPYATQFARVERLFTNLHGEKPKKDIQFYITSLSAEEAGFTGVAGNNSWSMVN